MLVAGDTFRWQRSLGDYPPDVWTLQYAFIAPAGFFSVTATDDGDGNHLAELLPAVTAPIVPDLYQWSATVTDGTDRYTVGQGTTRVEMDATAQSNPIDTRSHARKVLQAIEAVLEGTATTDQASYSLEGVSISRMPIADLMSFRDRYRWEVSHEENRDRMRKGLPPTWNIGVRL